MRLAAILVLLICVIISPAMAEPEVDAEGGLVVETETPKKPESNKTEEPNEEAATEAEADVPMVRSVKLRAINKITARTSIIEAQIGISANFGNLEIVARDCWKAPETESPENAALLDIWDRKRDERPERVFYGWMYSSTPSISTLEHAVYDITVVECAARKMNQEGAAE